VNEQGRPIRRPMLNSGRHPYSINRLNTGHPNSINHLNTSHSNSINRLNATSRRVSTTAAQRAANRTSRTPCNAVSETAIQIGMYVANCAALSASPSNVMDTNTSNTGST